MRRNICGNASLVVNSGGLGASLLPLQQSLGSNEVQFNPKQLM